MILSSLQITAKLCALAIDLAHARLPYASASERKEGHHIMCINFGAKLVVISYIIMCTSLQLVLHVDMYL